MVGVVSLDTLKMLEHQLFEAVILTGGLLFCAVLLFGLLFTRRLSIPMTDLERGMREIEKLAEVSLRKNSFYEIELLTENYNEMIRRIRQLMNDLSAKEKNTASGRQCPDQSVNLTFYIILWIQSYGWQNLMTVRR